MVVFACNHCGESLKKQTVEKHFNFKCRGAPKNISCMDCQKDFYGEEYVAHTKCITEAEKYSGKDYVPKQSNNSGQKKQESWMEIICSILDTKEYELNARTRSIFQRLQTVDNVPRKKAKFINFAANCMQIDKRGVEEIWTILEKELEKIKAAKQQKTAPQTNGDAKEPVVKNAPEEPVEEKEKSIGDEVVAMRVKKSKSKKRRVDKEIQNNIEQDEETEILQKVKDEVQKDHVGVTVEPSKKKSKKQAEETTPAEQETTISTTSPEEFEWSLVILFTIQKYGNSMSLDKLKKKVQKMYIRKRGLTEFNERQQTKFDKKFAKQVKKCNLKIEDNEVKVE